MPTYEFRCPACGAEETLVMTYEERGKRRLDCPKCGGKLEPRFGPIMAKTSRKS